MYRRIQLYTTAVLQYSLRNMHTRTGTKFSTIVPCTKFSIEVLNLVTTRVDLRLRTSLLKVKV